MKLEDKVQNTKLLLASELRKSIFDWIAAVIVVAVVGASLDVFGLLDLRNTDVFEFIVSWMPYFLAAILLNIDLYKKGIFVGKNTVKFTSVISSYSSIVNTLTGKQIKDLQPFCDKYNEDAIINMQSSILRKEGITYEMFDEGYTINDQKVSALKTLTKTQLAELNFNKFQIKAIRSAKNVSIKGLNVNILLSSMNIKDPTNIGAGEKELATRRMITSFAKYFFATLCMSVIAVKDITTWGWTGAVLVLFKVSYMFAGCYMSYFRAYDDITINVANHVMRKTDILKMYLNYIPFAEENSIVD